jgi:hypothetical protein
MSSLVGVILLYFQTSYLRKQLANDNERPRREKAVDLIMAWSQSLQRETRSAELLVSKFNEDQAHNLFYERSVEIDNNPENERLLITCLGSMTGIQKNQATNKLILEPSSASSIRWQVLTYLNTLEAILAAWDNNVANREMIEKEFNYVYDPQKRYNVVKNFRDAAGGDKSYPAIEAFLKKIKGNSTVSQAQQPLEP